MPRVAVVTAASKGIGSSTAVAFAHAGYDVVINYNHDTEAAQATAQAVELTGQKATIVQADVFAETGVNKLFAAIKQTYGTIDVLVNNAGLPEEPPFGKWTEATISRSLAGNVVSAALCTQATVPLMKKGGSILFTSSIYGLNFGGSPSLTLYSAGKAAIINLAQSMAEKLAPDIRCNVVAPGTTKTPAWDGASKAYVDTSLGMTLQKEWVAADEIADAFVFLTQAPHITAQTIVVDAGWQKKVRPGTATKH